MRKIFFVFLIFVFVFLSNNYLLCCSGSCLKCHENLNLEKPAQHKIIKECIKCHGEGCGEAGLYGDKSAETSCGADCFDCHTELPNNEVHKLVLKCIKCHEKLSNLKE